MFLEEGEWEGEVGNGAGVRVSVGGFFYDW